MSEWYKRTIEQRSKWPSTQCVDCISFETTVEWQKEKKVKLEELTSRNTVGHEMIIGVRNTNRNILGSKET